MPLRKQKDHSDELPTLPKRQIVTKPPTQETTSRTLNLNQASETVEKVAVLDDNEAVITSSHSPSVILDEFPFFLLLHMYI